MTMEKEVSVYDMIEIVISGPCKRCKHIELYLEQIELSDFYKQRYAYNIHCVHEDVCAMWEAEKKNAETFFLGG